MCIYYNLVFLNNVFEVEKNFDFLSEGDWACTIKTWDYYISLHIHFLIYCKHIGKIYYAATTPRIMFNDIVGTLIKNKLTKDPPNNVINFKKYSSCRELVGDYKNWRNCKVDSLQNEVKNNPGIYIYIYTYTYIDIHTHIYIYILTYLLLTYIQAITLNMQTMIESTRIF